VFYVEWRYRGEDNAYLAQARTQQLPLAIIAVDQERATRAGAIKQKHGLGYADSFAAELAIERSAWLVTADREFEKLGKHLLTLMLPRR
jgi:predicted nucleic acid-binding protein